MKNKALLFTLLTVLLVAGAYYTYTYLLQPKSIGYWEMIPTSAVAVYQRSDCEECVDSIRSSAWMELWRRKLLQNTSGDTAFVAALTRVTEKADFISLHRTTKNDFDFIFYTKLDLGSDRLKIDRDKSEKKQDRIFDGLIVHERLFKKLTLAWIQKDKYIAWSLSAVLIEDVIRAINKEGHNSFRDKLGDAATLPVVKNDAGDIFIDLREFKNWLGGFTADGGVEMPTLGKASLLDIKRSNNTLTLNGFSTVDSVDQQSLLSVFEGQAPVSFTLKRFISNEAQFVIHLGFSDSKLLGERLQKGHAETSRAALLKSLSLSDAELTNLYEGLGQEFALASMELGSGVSAPVLVVDVKGSGKWMETLGKIAKSTSTDTVFVEQFSAYSIKKIPVGGLVELVFPILKKKYTGLYYVQVGNVIMMAEDLRALKIVLQDFDMEDTWAKSMEKNRFLESTLLESNISFYLDPTRSKKVVLDALHPDWASFYASQQQVISKLGVSAIQFSFLNKNFYTNIHVTFAGGSTSKKSVSSKEISVSLPSTISSKIFIVRNHNDKSNEIVVQDSLHQIYLINTKGEILWKRQLDGFIKGELIQVDYFANGKLQLLISTEKSLHIIDRLSNYVKPYPVSLGFSNELIRLVDYDHSKKYRFLLADKQGVVRMTDKEGGLLEGWEGLKLGGELLAAPRHYRIAAKDYIIVAQKSGKVQLFTRRGELLKGFPTDLKTRPLGDFYYEEQSKDNAAGFVVIGAEGYRLKVDLKGEELSRETLIKSSIETQFKLVPEDTDKGYVIAKQDNKSVTLLSEKLEPILTNEFIGLNQTDSKYHDFGAGKIYYVLIDQDQDLGYVYGANGVLLTAQPIPCHDLSVMYSQNKLWLVAVQGNQLRLSTFE